MCLQPWAHLDRSAAACGRWLEGIGRSPEGVILLNPLPLHHISGLMPWWRSRLWGAQHVSLPPPLMKDPPSLLASCSDLPGWGQKQAVVSLVPTQLKRLLDHPEGVAWLQDLVLVWVGGACLPAPLAERARELSSTRHNSHVFTEGQDSQRPCAAGSRRSCAAPSAPTAPQRHRRTTHLR